MTGTSQSPPSKTQPGGHGATVDGISPDAVSADNIRTTLSSRGVVHLENFIDAEAIHSIKSEVDYLFDNFQQLPVQISPRADAGNIREIANLVTECPAFKQSSAYRKCRTLASAIFGRPCHYGFDHAIKKAPGSTAVNWHQDQFYSNFDRDKQCVSFWIPLQAVTPINGGMQYAVSSPFSKHLFPHTQVAEESFMYQVAEEHLAGYTTISPEMNIGDVCLHTPMTLHRSHPNNGTEHRSAWILQFNKFGPMRFARWGNLRKQFARLVSG